MSGLVPSLEARGITCLRGEACLFEDLSFAIAEGEALQVEGANGSGKTSLLRIVAGLSLPEDGIVLWEGQPVRDCRHVFNAQLAYLGHHLGLKAELTVSENLRFAARIMGAPFDIGQCDDVLDRLGLLSRRDIAVRVLSAGQKQRLAIARMLLMNVKLWVLDEPFTSLDQAAINLVCRVLDEHLSQGGLAVVTSHQPIALESRLRTLRLS